MTGSSSAQGDLWSAGARDFADLQSRGTVPLWQAMLDTANVARGVRLLDLGCGGGGACVEAAARGAHVSGLDATEAFIEIARERVPEGDFRVGDLENLPYGDGAFDVVFACNSLQFAANRLAALREMRRVCTPGGAIVIGIWAPPERSDQFRILRAVAEVTGNSEQSEKPFALSAPGVLESLLAAADLALARIGEITCTREYPDLETCWRGQRSSGPLQAALRQVDEDCLKAAVLTAAEPFRTPEGGVRMFNHFRFLKANRPQSSK